MNKEEATLQSRIRTTLSFSYITSGTRQIRVVKGGKGPPLLLIHGANIGWGQWYKNIDAFSSRFTVYAFDFPNAGASSRLSYTAFDSSKDLLDVCRDVIDHFQIYSCIALGHSIGGWVGLQLALQDPEIFSALIVTNSLGFTHNVTFSQRLLSFFPFVSFLSRYVVPPDRKHLKKFLGDAMCDPSFLEDEFVDYYVSAVLRSPVSHPFMFMHACMDFFRLKSQFVLSSQLESLHVPTLALFGASDPLISVSSQLQALSSHVHITTHVFSDVGHTPFLEKPDVFNDAVFSWLDTV